MSKGVRVTLLRTIAGVIGAVVGVVTFAIAYIAITVALLLLSVVQLVGPVLVWQDTDWVPALIIAAIGGFVWGFGVRRLRPSMGRGLLAWIYGFAIVAIPVMFLRWVLGLAPWSAGSVIFIAGFLSAFIALWGMGGFSPGYNLVETAGEAVERDVLDTTVVTGAFDPIRLEKHSRAFLRTRILPIVRPLLGPMVIALGVVLLVIVAVMAVGSLFPGRIQTDDLSAAATTPAGYMVGVVIFGQPVTKLAFFAVIVVLVFGGIASIALGLALLINALNAQVLEAKAEPAHPLDYSDEAKTTDPLGHTVNFLIRFRVFLTEWIADLVSIPAHWFSR